MIVRDWQPTDEQTQRWKEKGYFVLPGAVTADQAAEMRGVIEQDYRPSQCGKQTRQTLY